MLGRRARHGQAVRLQARRSRRRSAMTAPIRATLPDQVLLRRAVGRASRARRRRPAVRDDDAAADERADRGDAGRRSAAGRGPARPRAIALHHGRASSTRKPIASAQLLGARVTLIAADGRVVGDSSETLEGVAAMENHGAAAGGGRGARQRPRTVRSATATRSRSTCSTSRSRSVHPAIAFVRVALPLTDVRQQLEPVLTATLAALGVALLGGAAIAWLFSRAHRPARPAHRRRRRPLPARRPDAAAPRLRRRRARRRWRGRWTNRCRRSDAGSPSRRAIAPAWRRSSPAWSKASSSSIRRRGCSWSTTRRGRC